MAMKQKLKYFIINLVYCLVDQSNSIIFLMFVKILWTTTLVKYSKKFLNDVGNPCKITIGGIFSLYPS